VVSSVPLLVGKALRKWGLGFSAAWSIGVAAVVGLGGVAVPAGARESAPVSLDAMATVRLSDLPTQARDTERLIRQGGPFPYAKDGTVFGNRERLLPRKPRGHYREYTVRTPGSRDRGARRIVCGGEQPREPEACFYTQDHYASFQRIVQ
jgi:ribonuclease T1